MTESAEPWELALMANEPLFATTADDPALCEALFGDFMSASGGGSSGSSVSMSTTAADAASDTDVRSDTNVLDELFGLKEPPRAPASTSAASGDDDEDNRHRSAGGGGVGGGAPSKKRKSAARSRAAKAKVKLACFQCKAAHRKCLPLPDGGGCAGCLGRDAQCSFLILSDTSTSAATTTTSTHAIDVAATADIAPTRSSAVLDDKFAVSAAPTPTSLPSARDDRSNFAKLSALSTRLGHDVSFAFTGTAPQIVFMFPPATEVLRGVILPSIVAVNDEFCALSGMARHELIGRSGCHVIRPLTVDAKVGMITDAMIARVPGSTTSLTLALAEPVLIGRNRWQTAHGSTKLFLCPTTGVFRIGHVVIDHVDDEPITQMVDLSQPDEYQAVAERVKAAMKESKLFDD